MCIKKYLKSPKKYKYVDFLGNCFTGFNALCEEIKHIIMYEE